MHRTEQILVNLSREEVLRSRADALLLCAELQAMWAAKGIHDISTQKQILLTEADVEIKIHYQRLALKCIDCGCLFDSETLTEESTCPNDPDSTEPDSGVDAWFPTKIAQGEMIRMYGPRMAKELPKDEYNRRLAHDLFVQKYYMPPAGSNDGFENEGYYAGSDPTELHVTIDSRARKEKKLPRAPKPKSYLSKEHQLLLKQLRKRQRELDRLVKGRNEKLYEEYRQRLEWMREALRCGLEVL